MADAAPSPEQDLAESLPSLDFLSAGVDLATRTIYVGDIDDGAAELFIKQMHLLLMHKREPIHVILNSRGGSLIDGLAMYDLMRTAGVVISVEALGHCMSAAVLVAQGGDRRLIHQNCRVLLHNPSHSGHDGDALSFEAWGKQSVQDRKEIYELLAKHTGKTSRFWRTRCGKGDWIANPTDAVKHGLFDEILPHDD